MGHHQPPEPSVPRNELNAQTLLYANGSIEDRREDRIWFDPKHGYGFIKPDDGAHDVFVRPFVRAAAFDGGAC